VLASAPARGRRSGTSSAHERRAGRDRKGFWWCEQRFGSITSGDENLPGVWMFLLVPVVQSASATAAGGFATGIHAALLEAQAAREGG